MTDKDLLVGLVLASQKIGVSTTPDPEAPIVFSALLFQAMSRIEKDTPGKHAILVNFFTNLGPVFSQIAALLGKRHRFPKDFNRQNAIESVALMVVEKAPKNILEESQNFTTWRWETLCRTTKELKRNTEQSAGNGRSRRPQGLYPGPQWRELKI